MDVQDAFIIHCGPSADMAATRRRCVGRQDVAIVGVLARSFVSTSACIQAPQHSGEDSSSICLQLDTQEDVCVAVAVNRLEASRVK